MMKRRRKTYRFINGTKGVISLFLACLLVPFTTLACALLTAARINSAVAIFDEALCNASNSTLGTYDSFLRKRFGLLAMEQNTSGKKGVGGTAYTINDLINETFDKYLKENLKTLSNTYTKSQAEAKGVYALADTDILLAQILEYSKYSVPTKMLTDGLDLDDLAEYIEKYFKGGFAITDFISSMLGSFGSMITLCGDYQTLKNDVSNEETSKKSYTNKWTAFQTAASAYKNKYDEMQRKIQEQQGIIDAESPNVESQRNAMNSAKIYYDQSTDRINAYTSIIQRLECLRDGKTISPGDNEFLNNLRNNYGFSLSQEEYDSYCQDYESSINYFEDLKKQETTNNNSLKSSYNQTKSAYDSSNSKITAAQQEISNIQTTYAAELNRLESDANSKKAEYISALETLQDKLKATKNSLTTVQGDIISATSSLTNTVTQGISSSLTLQRQNVEKQLSETDKLISEYEKQYDAQKVQELYSQRSELQKQYEELSDNNNSEYAKAFSSGLSSGLNSIKIGEKDKNIADYDSILSELDNAKSTTQGVVDYRQVLPSGCYVSFNQVVTPDEAKTMWKSFLKQLFSSTLWATIDSMKTILKTLLAFEGAVNSALNALVDAGYFPNGLPSTQNTKSVIIEDDKNKSSGWKDLLGSYSTIGDDANGTGDLINVLNTMSGQFDSIAGTDKGSEDQEPSETKSFFSTCKDLFTGFLNLITTAIDSVKEIFNTSNLYQKLLVSGYFVYMTQNRTTYTDENLSGNSFNLRGQPTSTSETGLVEGGWNSFAGLFGAVGAMSTVNTRCFFGAETEYLFGKSMNELQNQKSTFGLIYLIRLVFDLPSLLMSSDFISLVSSLAPTIIGAVVIVFLYVLVEPLLDTLILVNGGQIPIIKTAPFLTSNGFKKLMKCISSCSNGKLNQDSVKETLANNMNDMYYKSGTTMNSNVSIDTGDNLLDKWNPLNIDYTEQLLLLTICCNQDDILDCLSDIIQMEGSENQQHKDGDVKSFDLTQAFTYIRVEASFTTQEFIKLTDTGMFNSTERIMYRGY